VPGEEAEEDAMIDHVDRKEEMNAVAGADVAVADELCAPDSSGAAQLSTSMQRAAAIIAKRWTPLILYVLQGPPLRFGEIAARIPFVSDKMVSERLKELEAEGIVSRHIFAEVPVRVEYRLTEKGRDLNPVVAALAAWGCKWLEDTPEGARAPTLAAAPAAPEQS
jgi:DNA-binding HxlR family transcriptional regulator